MTASVNRGSVAPVILLVCGGRDYDDREHVFATLDRLNREIGPIGKVVHGAARGADSHADAWAKARGIDVKPYDADWKRYKRSAGPIRNREMLAKERPTHVAAFPGNDGTADMVKIARAAGVDVIEIDARAPKDSPDTHVDDIEPDEPTNPFLRAAMGRHRG